MIKNPMAMIMWQFVFAYKLEAENKEYDFTDQQKKELLDLMEIAEKNHESINPRKMHKMNMAFHNFDKKFVEFGGNIDNLSAKVDEISSKLDSRIVKLGDTIMDKPHLLTNLKCGNFRFKKRA